MSPYTSLKAADMEDAMVHSLCSRMNSALKLNIPASRAAELEDHIKRVCMMHANIECQVRDLQQSACTIEVWCDSHPNMFAEDATVFLALQPNHVIVWRFVEACNATCLYEVAYDSASNRWYVVGSNENSAYISIEDEPFTQPGSPCFWNVTRTSSTCTLNLPILSAWLHRMAELVSSKPDLFHNVCNV